jgi:tetratricopeptide (TPR) repeat protein
MFRFLNPVAIVRRLATATKYYATYVDFLSFAENRKKLENSESHLKASLELNPELVDAHAKLASLLRYREEFCEAEAHLRRALEVDTNNSDTHFDLGILLGDRGRPEEAKKHLDRALELDPNNILFYTECQSLEYMLLRQRLLEEKIDGWEKENQHTSTNASSSDSEQDTSEEESSNSDEDNKSEQSADDDEKQPSDNANNSNVNEDKETQTKSNSTQTILDQLQGEEPNLLDTIPLSYNPSDDVIEDSPGKKEREEVQKELERWQTVTAPDLLGKENNEKEEDTNSDDDPTIFDTTLYPPPSPIGEVEKFPAPIHVVA